jgi:hypothetical protein
MDVGTTRKILPGLQDHHMGPARPPGDGPEQRLPGLASNQTQANALRESRHCERTVLEHRFRQRWRIEVEDERLIFGDGGVFVRDGGLNGSLM